MKVPARIDGKPNPEYHRLYAQRTAERFTQRTLKQYYVNRRAALEAYGGTPPVCACCGEHRYPFLALDHIAGNGAEERRTKGKGPRFWYYLKREGYPPGYRVLCHNCNQGRGQFSVCPHELERAAEKAE